jgi:hypothetical protein
MIGNESAFPVVEHRFDSFGERRMETIAHGMTIRQYFVAQAMVGIAANDACPQTISSHAEAAVKLADACLAREAETREVKA